MQINRMFEMIYLLLDQKIITAKELATRFEVSTRTIYRDIETLSSAGIPIYMSKGKGGGISILDDFILNKTVLTEEEKTDILSSLSALRAINFSETDSAIHKLSSLFGNSHSDWIEVDFAQWYTSLGEDNIFNAIKSSILSQTTISFVYASQKGEHTQREVEPLKLCFKGMSRYLYAYCRFRQDYRFFKLSRIKELTLTKEHFKRKSTPPIFNSNTKSAPESITLKLKFSPTIAYRVYDEFEHYTHEMDGSILVEVVYPKGNWLFPYIASFGQHCEVIEPLDIRSQVKDELKNMLKNYL